MTTLREAAQLRAAGVSQRSHRPRDRRAWSDLDDGPRGYVLGGTMGLRTLAVALDERAAGAPAAPGVVGVASVTDTPYEMYDFFGPYTEIVSGTAFDVTLAADPLVEFTLNHNSGGGAPMAHTRNGTLALAVTDDGLTYDASVDASRTDVSDMLKALDRGDLAESSFKFGIDAGRWNDSFDTYTIMQVNLDRGDVSSVNFGANPYATSGLRSASLKPGSALVTERDLALPQRSFV